MNGTSSLTKVPSSNNIRIRPRHKETSEEIISRLALITKLKQCGNRKELQEGQLLHSNAIDAGCHKNRYVASALISMYAKCGRMHDAQDVFENIIQRDVVSWNALLLGYVENGGSTVALNMFNSMDCSPDGVTFVAAFKACAGLASNYGFDKRTCLLKGLSIHKQALEGGFEKDIFVESALIDMYSKCGDMLRARDVFNRMTKRDAVCWTALILGYVENGESSVALDVFSSMDSAPDRCTFVAALKACAGMASDNKLDKDMCLQKGLALHRRAREQGFDKHVVVANTLLDMYTKCRDMLQAQDVFHGMVHRTVVSWNILILGYVENEESSIALDLFSNMDCAPNRLTFVAALKACAGLAAGNSKDTCLQKGLAIHRRASECGFDKDLFVANTLVEMYSKCGDMLQARDVFNQMTHRDIVSWTVLMLGYGENGENWVALNVFNNMDIAPNCVTFVAAIKACAGQGALEFGQSIHGRLCQLGFEQVKMVANCLVDFYGKCGNMAAAKEVFSGMHFQDIVSWNALIGGYSLLGDTSQVFCLVKDVQEAGLQMDNVTVMLVLTACSHAGKVEEGESFFESMPKYGIVPTVEHYTYMVDMLGRGNRLKEALSLAKGMPFEGNSRVWMNLLGACRKWSNLEVGRVAFLALMTRDNKETVAAAYVFMRNIYESLGMWQEGEQIEAERKRVNKPRLAKRWQRN